MKKLFLFALVTISINFANAQDYQPFRLYLGVGYTVPQVGGNGYFLNIEPAYRINDQITVGVRWGAAFLNRGGGNQGISASGNSSLTLNGKYHLGTSDFKPYLGAGFGIFGIGHLTVGINGAGTGIDQKIGFYPRIGFDFRRFNINIDYNFIPSSEIEGIDADGNVTTFDIVNSYLGIRLGAFVFGGKK